MRFLIIARRKAELTAEDYAPHREAEISQALRLLQDDSIRELYSFAEGGGAVLMLEAGDEAHAKAIMDTLPLVKLDMLDIEVHGLRAYGGFFAGVKPA